MFTCKKNGRIWADFRSYLDVSGYIWAGLSRIWTYLDVSGCIWAVFWSYLDVSGRIWVYLGRF